MPDLFIDKTKKNQGTLPSDKNPPVTNDALVGKPLSIFSTFGKQPSNITFHDQLENETILLFLRKHQVTNIPWITASIVLLFVPFLLVLVLSVSSISLLFFPARYFLFFLLFYYLIVAMFVFVNFITWFYNIFLVTQERVIDIDYSNIVYQNVAATKLGLVEEVHYTQAGFIRNFLNFGDVFVETAAEVSNFEAEAVPKPAEATRIIENLLGKGPATNA